MKIALLTGLLFCTTSFVKAGYTNGDNLPDEKDFPSLITTVADNPAAARLTDSLYNKFNLIMYGLDRTVFYKAYKGYQFLLNSGKLKKTNLLTIIDYSQSSMLRRMFVIDMEAGRVLFNTYVSHGKRSGGEYASMFSNINKSNMSSLGFMVTAESYYGKCGYSMRFDGMEKGINDKVRSRSVVMHGSKYVGEAAISARGKTGNSLGCPAIPSIEHKDIINTIKNGSCLFIYYPDMHYLSNSKVLNTTFDWPALQQPVVAEASTTETASATIK